MTSHIDPALLVAVPLVASILPVAGGAVSDRLAWPITAVTLALQTALAAVICTSALLDEPVSTTVGGVPDPFGIVLVVDPLSAPFVALTAVTGLGVLGYTRQAGPRSGPFYSLYLLLVAGVTGVCITADVFNLYVFLEISGLASYALVAQTDGGDAAVAALKYLLLGTVGASLYLLGVGYAYIGTGTLNMAILAAKFGAAGGLGATIPVTAFGLMIVGLGVKMAVFPLHVWKPDAYEAAPPAVAAILSALVSTVAAYAVVRLLLTAFTVEFLVVVPLVETMLLTVGVLSIGAGSLLAYREPDVRRLLAYSSVSQFGIVTVGIALATPIGLVGVVIHLVGHAITKGGFYLAAGALARGYGLHTVDDYAGLGGRSPLLSVAIGVFALGLIGIPPTVGFAGKLYVLLATIEGSAPVAGAVVLASTLASLAYFGRLLQRMFVEPPPGGPDSADHAAVSPDGGEFRQPSLGAVVIVLLAALLTVALGFGAAGLAELTEPTIRRLVS